MEARRSEEQWMSGCLSLKEIIKKHLPKGYAIFFSDGKISSWMLGETTIGFEVGLNSKINRLFTRAFGGCLGRIMYISPRNFAVYDAAFLEVAKAIAKEINERHGTRITVELLDVKAWKSGMKEVRKVVTA